MAGFAAYPVPAAAAHSSATADLPATKAGRTAAACPVPGARRRVVTVSMCSPSPPMLAVGRVAREGLADRCVTVDSSCDRKAMRSETDWTDGQALSLSVAGDDYAT